MCTSARRCACWHQCRTAQLKSAEPSHMVAMATFSWRRPVGTVWPTTPLYISPEGIVCWSVDMMEGCESTRARGVLKFERSLTSLRLDMQRLCKEPLLDAVSGRAIGRDSVMRYRASYALYLKKLGCLRK